MKHPKRSWGLGMLFAFLVGIVPGSEIRMVQPGIAAPTQAVLPLKLVELVQNQGPESGDGLVELDFQVLSKSDIPQLKQAIAQAGGQVLLEERSYVRSRVPVSAAGALSKVQGVTGVGTNESLSLDPNQIHAAGRAITPIEAERFFGENTSPMGLREFRQETGVNGQGVLVAVIDSGIDPGHPDLGWTPDGRPKVVDWKDYTKEGSVVMSAEVSSGLESVNVDGATYLLPGLSGVQAARFGYLEEHYVDGYINQDLDRNGRKIDRFGVLALNRSGRFDTVLVDTNNDRSFLDERPLGVYRETYAYDSLGYFRDGELSLRRLNFVVADIDPAGRSVQLGFDSHGHGTWVSGVLGASGPGGYNGIAPGVQLMALKVLRSTSGGDWFHIKDAVQYAASHGASIINISIGNLASGAAKLFDSGASEWLDQIASRYGVLIVLAAGNSGPGLSSGTTLGNPASVMAVGGYFSPAMWKRDYGWVVPHETVWFFSGMGPRSDGTYLPSVVAPAGSPVPSPQWRDPTGYTTASGTSIATPHVAGAAALLMDAGREAGLSHDWLSVKQALEMGARRIPDFEVYEQGNGLVQIQAAYAHLQHISAAPVLKAAASDGGGYGMLARSVAPGSGAFTLSNPSDDPARVGIYSSESWVRPGLVSALLPPRGKRVLPMQISPPEKPGVHSAFLTVTQQNKYAPSLVLPVTVVRAQEFGPSNNFAYATSDQLEVGRYRRYFFTVPQNAEHFSVAAKMATGESGRGTIQVHVFRPDGQVLHINRIGMLADGVSSLFETHAPIPGVWEVVVVALPDQEPGHTNPGYSLDVKLTPGAAGRTPLRYSVPAGATATFPVRFSNVFGAFTGGAEAIGLVKAEPSSWNQSIPAKVKPRLGQTIETFTLKEFTSELQLEISSPTRFDINEPLEKSTDLSLYLYRLVPDGNWELRRQSVTLGQNHETISLSYLPAGQYRVMMTSGTDSPLQYQYRRLVGYDNFNVSIQDPPRNHGVGDNWTANMTIKAPGTPGRYTGYILMRDTEGKRILAWYPFEVSVGQPALAVSARIPQLTRGRPGSVVLEVRDAQRGSPITGVGILVNGRGFLVQNGQVVVPLTPAADTEVLEIEADLPGYQFVRTRFTFPVKDAWGSYPLGIDKNQEIPTWRRKVINQLP